MPLVLAMATFFSTLAGGMVALRSRKRLHLVLGFAAGVLLGVVAFDLLPEVFSLAPGRTLGIPTVMLTFAAGFLVLHVLERTVAMHQGRESDYGAHRHPTVGVISALALSAHSFMDGVGIGLGFQAGEGVGVAVAVAVIAHDFADGLNTYTIMMMNGNNRRRSLALLGVDAVAPMIGAGVTLLFTVSERILSLYLGFFAGFLLYLATGDILPEAHSRHPSGRTLVATVAGMGFMWAVVGAS